MTSFEEFQPYAFDYTYQVEIRRHELRFPGGSLGRHKTPISSPNWTGALSLRSRVSRNEHATCSVSLGEMQVSADPKDSRHLMGAIWEETHRN